MFTGLIEDCAAIAGLEDGARDRRLRIEPAAALLADLQRGDSIAVAGVCLTATAIDDSGFWVDVSAETLAHTTLGDRGVGDAVNLARALLPTTRLGGHLVSGHVDGVGDIVDKYPEGESWRFRFRVPAALQRYVAPKGSICLDGISLTVNEVEDDVFGVNIIPHTLEQTNLGRCRVGSRVNIEIDLVARYLERLMGLDARGPDGALRHDLLAGKD